MSEFGAPSQVLRLLVGGDGGGADAAPMGRRASQWQRQIESLDTKEMELQQAQLKLIREQTEVFVRDLSAVRHEVAALRHQQEASGADGAAASDQRHRELRVLVDRAQREQSSACEALHLRLVALERDAPAVRADVEELRGAVRDLPRAVRELRAALQQEAEERSEALGRVDRRLGEAREADVAGELRREMREELEWRSQEVERRLAQQLKSVEDAFGQHEENLARLQGSVGGNFEQFDYHHGSLNERLENLMRDVDLMVSTKLGFVEARLATTESGVEAQHGRLGERVASLERSLEDGARRGASQQAAVLERLEDGDAARRQLDSLQRRLSEQQASMQERVAFLEKAVGDSAQRHASELAMAKSKLDQVSEALSEKDRHLSELRREHLSKQQSHASLEERVAFLETNYGDSADRHSAALRELQTAQERHRKSLTEQSRAVDELRGHASALERLDRLERSFGDAAARHDAELQSVRAEAQSRFAACEAQGAALGRAVAAAGGDAAATASHVEAVEGEVRAARERQDAGLAKVAKDLDALRRSAGQQAALAERVDALDRLLGDASGEHRASWGSLQESVDKLQGRCGALEKAVNGLDGLRRDQDRLSREKEQLSTTHAGTQERLDYLERLVGDSADRHAAEVAELRRAHERHAATAARHADGVRERTLQHASIEQRLDYIEELLGDSADKHGGQIAAAHAKVEAMQSRLSTMERASSVGRAGGEDVAALRQGLAVLERALGEMAERQARDIAMVREAQARQARDAEDRRRDAEDRRPSERLAAFEDRLERLDGSGRRLRERVDGLEASLAARPDAVAAQARLESACGQLLPRLAACEARCASLAELQREPAGFERPAAELQQSTLKERVDFLERLMSESAERQSRLLEAAHGKLDHLQGRLTSLERGAAPGAAMELQAAQAEAARQAAVLEAQQAAQAERLGRVEALAREAAERQAVEAEGRGREAAAAAREAEALRARQAGDAERLGRLERALAEASERQGAELSALGRAAERLRGELQEERAARERAGGTVGDLLARERHSLDAHHATVKQRVEYLEGLIGDNADKHAKQIAEAKSQAVRLATEVSSQDDRHGTIGERMEALERSHRETARKCEQQLHAFAGRLDDLFGRLSVFKETFTSPSEGLAGARSASPLSPASLAAGARPLRVAAISTDFAESLGWRPSERRSPGSLAGSTLGAGSWSLGSPLGEGPRLEAPRGGSPLAPSGGSPLAPGPLRPSPLRPPSPFERPSSGDLGLGPGRLGYAGLALR